MFSDHGPSRPSAPCIGQPARYVPVVSTIDYSADRLNLDAGMRQLASSVQERVHNRSDPSKPLYVLVGEMHTMPMHTLAVGVLYQHVVRSVLQNGALARVLVQVEMPRNWKDILAYIYPSAALPDDFLPARYLAAFDWDLAPASRHTLGAIFAACAAPVQTIDAAREPDNGYLDQTDPAMQAALTETGLGFDKDPGSPAGMALRDHIMVQTDPMPVDGQAPDIIVRSLGCDHLLGHRSEGNKLHHSQAALLTERGHDVVCYFPETQADDHTLEKVVDPDFRALSTAFLHVVRGVDMDEAEFTGGFFGTLFERFNNYRIRKRLSPGIILPDGTAFRRETKHMLRPMR